MMWCAACQGTGTVDCHCGGDLCVCDNYGEMDFWKCGGVCDIDEDAIDDDPPSTTSPAAS
jgi:hypothetical protein